MPAGGENTTFEGLAYLISGFVMSNRRLACALESICSLKREYIKERLEQVARNISLWPNARVALTKEDVG